MNDNIDLKELHWLLTITQSIDVGVVVLDRDYRVQVWNTFMENRSGVVPSEAAGQSFSKCSRKSMNSGSAGKSTTW